MSGHSASTAEMNEKIVAAAVMARRAVCSVVGVDELQAVTLLIECMLVQLSLSAPEGVEPYLQANLALVRARQSGDAEALQGALADHQRAVRALYQAHFELSQARAQGVQ